MSNFDFGGGPGQGYGFPGPHQPPHHPGQQPPPPGAGSMPPGQPPDQPPAEPTPTEKVGGGITPVGVIGLLALILVMLGVAFVGNRVWPINSRIDSAWRSMDGNAQELTDGLRKAGYTCSDADLPGNRQRLCAKYDAASSVAVEFAGTGQGEIQGVRISSSAPLTQQDLEDVGPAVDLSIPDPNHEAAAQLKLARGASDTQQISGPWGTAGYDGDGVFVIDRGWSGAIPMVVPGGVDAVRQAAGEAAYACDAGTTLTCQRTADAAVWTLTVSGTTPESLDRLRLEGIVTDPERLDVAAELAAILPPGPSRNRVIWFVRTGDHTFGQAGFAGGVPVDYQVTRRGDQTTNVSVTIR